MIRIWMSMLAMIVALSAVPGLLVAEEAALPLDFDAVAVNMSNVGPRGQVRLQIRVTRWSTDEERARLLEAIKAQSGRRGDRELAESLFGKESVGTIRETGTLAQ